MATTATKYSYLYLQLVELGVMIGLLGLFEASQVVSSTGDLSLSMQHEQLVELRH